MSDEQVDTPTLRVEPVVTNHEEVLHYLCSVMAQGGEADPQAFAQGMATVLGQLGIVPIMSTAYVSKYASNVSQSGLKDQWLKVCASEKAREDFLMAWPDLGRSIDFICGITNSDIASTPSED